MEPQSIGKMLVAAGLAIAGIGVLVWLLAASGLPLGRLPGDINVKGPSGSFHFPIVTCIVLSIVLTVLLNLFFRGGR